jgi:hypothetical protein
MSTVIAEGTRLRHAMIMHGNVILRATVLIIVCGSTVNQR